MNRKINNDNTPIVIKLPEIKDNIFDHDEEPVFSTNIDYPKFSLGFHHYIHQSKDKMKEILNDFKSKKKVYLVMNKYEPIIDDYDKAIGNVADTYFSLKSKPKILNNAFYKLWEMLMTFDLIPNNDKIVTAHLAEGSGAFIQATIMYRDMFAKNVNGDKYYALTLHPDDIKGHIEPLDEAFIKHYKSEKPSRFVQHRTFSRKMARGNKNKDNGDLTDPKTIKLFTDDLGDTKADFITADGGFNWTNESTQEQDAFKLIISQICVALKIQKKGGNFVCKIYESFSLITSKLICILLACYTNVHITKPFTSRKGNSEKYLVCIGFKGINDKYLDKLENVLKQSYKNKNKNIVNIFPKFDAPKYLLTTLTYINDVIANRQYISINEIVDFVNKQNYRGDEYHDRKEMQIKSSEFWIDRYFVDKSKLQDSKKVLTDELNKIVEQNKDEIDKFDKILE